MDSGYICSAYSAGTSLLVEGSFHSFVNKGWKGSVLRGFSLALASCCVLLITYLFTNQAFAITGNDSWFFILPILYCMADLIVYPLVFRHWSLLIEIHFTFQVKAKVCVAEFILHLLTLTYHKTWICIKVLWTNSIFLANFFQTIWDILAF